MDAPDVIPPGALRISSLQEAAEISQRGGIAPDSLFKYARAILAMEENTGVKLPFTERRNAFGVWWALAKLPDTYKDQYEFDFERAMASAKSPLGANTMAMAIRLADANPLVRFESLYGAKMARLASVCYYLQEIVGDDVFFISSRAAMEIVGAKAPHAGSSALRLLEKDGILKVVLKGNAGGRKATRFRFTATVPGAGHRNRHPPLAT